MRKNMDNKKVKGGTKQLIYNKINKILKIIKYVKQY
jgi:hypothetical protein